MRQVRLVALCSGLLLLACGGSGRRAPDLAPAPPASPAGTATLDRYGGYRDLPAPGGATGFFRLAKVNKRWVFVSPEGNVFWLRAVYVVDWIDGAERYQAKLTDKYGGTGFEFTQQAVRRLKAWGFNALGEYASSYAVPVPMYGRKDGNPEKAPFIHLYNASYYTMLSGQLKNINAGVDTEAAFPGIWLGLMPDVFDPGFAPAVDGFVKNPGEEFGDLKVLSQSPWLIGLSMDDADYTSGLKAREGSGHPHLGWVAAVTSPTQAKGQIYGNQVSYTDKKVYTKHAFRDFLRSKYRTLEALNTVWESTYTTWDSDGGWPLGRGVLDESGRNSWLGGDWDNLTTARRRVKADLNEFLFRIADKYFEAYARAIRTHLPNHLVFTPAALVWPRRPVLKAAARWVDVIQASNDYEVMREIYDVTGKPIFVWSTFTAQADSNLINPPPGWESGVDFPTQAARGEAYAKHIDALLGLRGTNGDFFIVGIDWWEWVDKVTGGENMNFGLVSVLDNAYDGKEAVIAAGTDPWGYPTGGENRNYGNFLTSVVDANRKVWDTLSAELTETENEGRKR